MMKRIFLAAVVATFAAGSAFADDTCASKAVGEWLALSLIHI